MEKKNKTSTDNPDATNAFEDTRLYGAGQEADETLTDENEEDKTVGYTNGGIPDDTGDENDDEDDSGDTDDE